jgi:hypothetical protein
MSYENDPQCMDKIAPIGEALAVVRHARERMSQRGIKRAALLAVLEHGRVEHRPDALVYIVGRKEVERCRRCGLRLERYEGIHVVTSPNGTILTTYRNRALNLRPSRRRALPRRARCA